MKTRGVALIAVVAILLAACGDGGSDVAEPAGTPEGPPAATPSPGTSEDQEPQGEVDVEVWFQQGEKLFLSHRGTAAAPRVGTAAMEALLEAPSRLERSVEVGTSIPSGTELRGLTISDGVATVDLSGEFGSGGGSLSMQMRVAQVVYTLTQFPTVSGVVFEIDGDRVTALGGEGLVLDEPQTRRDHRDALGQIVVETPAAGEEISGSVQVSGNANVFEATVSLRLVTEAGRVLAEDFTTATCGSGCRGDYDTNLRFRVPDRTSAILEVYESSAEDGSPLHMVRVPITLLP